MSIRTQAYKFTTSDINDPEIEKIKHHAKVLNAGARLNELIMRKPYDRCRIVVRGRLGDNNPNAPLYRRGGKLYRMSAQMIKHEHATRFDVYMHFYAA